jgi:hypothetical protein
MSRSGICELVLKTQMYLQSFTFLLDRTSQKSSNYFLATALIQVYNRTYE